MIVMTSTDVEGCFAVFGLTLSRQSLSHASTDIAYSIR